MAYLVIKDREGNALSNYLVDDDSPALDFNWWSSHGYAVTRIGPELVYLHKFILDADKDQIVDHINGDKTDNRSSNLRFASKLQNNWNTKVSKRSSTGVKGVQYNPLNDNYRARIYFKGKQYEIGSFDTLADAALARKNKAIELQGEYAFEWRN